MICRLIVDKIVHMLRIIVMDKDILMQVGLSEMQANIYIYLVKHGQKTPTEIADGIGENRTTVYSAAEKLAKMGLLTQKDKGKVSAYVPNHPSALEIIAEKRLRVVARQAKNLESNLPSLINYFNEHQDEPGVATFYGDEGVSLIWNKIIAAKQPCYFVRSRFDSLANHEGLEEFKKRRVAAKIEAYNITCEDFAKLDDKKAKKLLLDRTVMPGSEYDSPVEIDIFGDNVAFINFEKNGMSTLIESPEIADAMRQFFLFARKFIRKANRKTDTEEKS